MNWTCEQEGMFLENMSRFAMDQVRKFEVREMHDYSNIREDLFQEVMLVILKHARKCNSIQEIYATLPYLDILNALTRYTIGCRVLSYPRRTNKYHAKTALSDTGAHAVDFESYSDIIGTSAGVSKGAVEQCDAKMDLELFLKTLSPIDREVFSLHMRGFHNNQIAERLGINDVGVCRRLKRIAKDYAAFICAA